LLVGALCKDFLGSASECLDRLRLAGDSAASRASTIWQPLALSGSNLVPGPLLTGHRAALGAAAA
jgi:hypothetical protein